MFRTHLNLTLHQPVVRTFCATDTPDLTKLLNDADILSGLCLGLCTAAAFDQVVSVWQAANTDKNILQLVVCKDANIVGVARIKNHEISYFIGKPHQREGLATLLINTICEEFWKTKNSRFVFALVHRNNRASIRTMEAAGFVSRGLSSEYLGTGIIEFIFR